ncbi:MAG TPA: tautomerase family protein [Holophaga sp.]|nr:tautomerase family protein [Holophaga sp.]
MPVITVDIQSMPHEDKKTLIAALTTSAAQATRIPEASFIILVNEYPEDAIGIGGRTLKEVKAARMA